MHVDRSRTSLRHAAYAGPAATGASSQAGMQCLPLAGRNAHFRHGSLGLPVFCSVATMFQPSSSVDFLT